MPAVKSTAAGCRAEQVPVAGNDVTSAAQQDSQPEEMVEIRIITQEELAIISCNADIGFGPEQFRPRWWPAPSGGLLNGR